MLLGWYLLQRDRSGQGGKLLWTEALPAFGSEKTLLARITFRHGRHPFPPPTLLTSFEGVGIPRFCPSKPRAAPAMFLVSGI